MRYILLFVSVFIIFKGQAQISHKQWDMLTKKHVTPSGVVNNKGFVKDSIQLNAYLKLMSNNPPKSTWSKNEELAYWINTYNAFTVKLMVKHYPVKSIKDLGGSIYKVNTSWDIKFIVIGGEKMDLNNIEHKKIRDQFKEPRIHFAVNCASVSCPKLRNEAFTAERLNTQLNDQARYFINNPIKNNTKDPANPQLSKLFNWYGDDFKENGNTVLDFINKYLDNKIPKEANVAYMNYIWTINE